LKLPTVLAPPSVVPPVELVVSRPVVEIELPGAPCVIVPVDVNPTLPVPEEIFAVAVESAIPPDPLDKDIAVLVLLIGCWTVIPPVPDVVIVTPFNPVTPESTPTSSVRLVNVSELFAALVTETAPPVLVAAIDPKTLALPRVMLPAARKIKSDVLVAKLTAPPWVIVPFV
jgi:hypothetical protein